ncbi:TetR/AcrR family transcriptional regulator [Salinibacter altiplanensis]|uniref:TetR/AcrR family transcriptional regulator n=1 Tax=Salinibacter altiplanensis TaxID=1803181 RepID=UPI000C9F888E|nr:TetR/AcrR family transcriptional regulator [Salinibacter altiplanensis]
MPRSPTFDRDAKIEQAMQLFWEKGYEATSVQDLVDHLELNRSSLYNAFGGKHELYLEALDRYRQEDIEWLRGQLRGAPTAVDGIRQAFVAVAERATESCCGCFTTNAAVECAPRDGSTQERARESFKEMRSLFRAAVERAQEAGAIDASRDAKALGCHLTNAYNGIHLTAKTDPPNEVVQDIVEATLQGITCATSDSPTAHRPGSPDPD